MNSRTLDARVAFEQVRLLYSQSPGGLIVTLVVAGVLGVVLLTQVPARIVFSWGFLIVLAVLLRYLIYQAYCRSLTQNDVVKWRRIFIVGAVVGGLAWSLGAVAFAPYLPDVYLFLMILVVCGLSVVSVAYLNSVASAHLGFLLGLNLPVIGWLLMTGGGQNLMLAVLVVLFCLAIRRPINVFNRALIRSLELQFENIDLVESLRDTNIRLREDIHQRRQREEELRLDHRQFQQLTRMARIGHWIYDRSAVRYQSVSPQCAEILGVSQEALLTTYWTYEAQSQLIVAEDRNLYRKIVGEALAADEGYRVEFRVHGEDGAMRYLAEVSEVVPDKHGNPTLRVGAFQDITESKRAEQELRDSTERFRAAFEGGLVGISIYTEAGLFLEVNDAYCDFLGYRREGLVNHSLFMVFFPEEADMVAETLKRLPNLTGEGLQFERRYRHKSGETRWGLVSLSLLPSQEGQRANYLSQVQDITKRIGADRERDRLLTELEHKNAELERFAYTISHDLKGPLISVRSFAGLLKLDVTAGNEERIASDVHRILEATEKMQQRLDNLLRLARVGHHLDLEHDVAVDEVCHSAIAMLSPQLATADVVIRVEENLPRITADRERLAEVFQNLIENAMKFRGNQPAPEIRVGLELLGEKSVFFVRDNGMGLESRFTSKIFDLFETLHAVDSTAGVGLAIVKRIVEAHHGRIWAVSEGPGCGSTFYFTLNAYDELEEPLPHEMAHHA